MVRLKATSILSLLTLLGCTAMASAQTGQIQIQPQGSANVLLAPLGSPGDVNSPQLFGVGDADNSPLATAIKIDLGFDFVQPIFANRNVSLAIPGPGGASGSAGNFSNNFTFLPRIAVEHPFGDLGFGVGASAKILEISGTLHRTLAATSGVNSSIDASGTVDIGSANVIEGVKLIDLGESNCFADTCLQDTLVVCTLGGRYSYVHQVYNATLAVANQQNQLIATQEYTGFGVTGSFNTVTELVGNFVFYSSTRGSFLLGNNDRSSSVTISTAGANGIKATDVRTTIVPALEWEAGIGYGLDLARPPSGPTPATAPLLWVKVGCVGQLWGNVGLLHINDTIGNQFSDSNLLLLGFTVQLGLDY